VTTSTYIQSIPCDGLITLVIATTDDTKVTGHVLRGLTLAEYNAVLSDLANTDDVDAVAEVWTSNDQNLWMSLGEAAQVGAPSRG
jgi:hypothetical protein